MLRPMDKFQKVEMFQRQALESTGSVGATSRTSTSSDDFSVDDINDRLGRGDKAALSELESRNIPFTIKENGNSYTVKYSYNGQNYIITYNAPATEETAPTGSDSDAGSKAHVYSQELLQNVYKLTTSEIEQYFTYTEYDLGSGKQSGWVLKTGQEVNGVVVNTLGDLLDALAKGNPQEIAQVYTQDLLQNRYNFTTSEIEQYFEYTEYDLGYGKRSGWVLKTGQEVNGIVIETLNDLVRALGKVDSTKPLENNGGVSPDEPAAPEEPTTPTTQEEQPSPEVSGITFDYTGVDKDAEAKGFYDVNNIPEEKRARVLLGGGSDVDSGAWDDLFAELDKMKPQLLNYIKTQLEAKGYEYDAAAAEKYLNVFITGAVDSIGVPGKSKKYTGGDVPVLPADPTIEDLMNYLKDRIDNEISRYETTDGDRRSQLAPNGEPFDGERSYYSQDYYLTDVADYYLTDEEKEMKFVLEVVESDSSSYGTSSLDKVKSYIDTYAKHMEKVLRYMYPECTDAQIQTAINHAKSVVLNISDVVKKDGDGFYPIDDILAEFEKECYDAIEKQPMPSNGTSNSSSSDDVAQDLIDRFKEQVNAIKTPQVENKEPEETPAADESEETEETPDVTFDYTDVNTETPVMDMCNEDELTAIEKLTLEKGYGNVDSAAWNDVFSELEKMKPQLLNYIKAQMEANGFKYDATIAERYVEIYMTEALQRGISDFSASFWNKDFDMPENPTVSDLVNYVKDRIDYEIEKYTVKSTGNPYLDQALAKLKGVPFSDTTYMQDYYLMDIADYFLTDEEKEMKFVMEAVQNESSTHYTSDKNKLVDYVDTYAKHMEKVLKSKYPDLTDSKIDSIINAAKTYTLYMDPPEPDASGNYEIDALLKAFEEKCIEYAES